MLYVLKILVTDELYIFIEHCKYVSVRTELKGDNHPKIISLVILGILYYSSGWIVLEVGMISISTQLH